MALPADGEPGRQRSQEGSGLIGLIAAFLVFMIMLFTAVQVAHNLYISTVLAGTAHDSARLAAESGSGTDGAARGRAEAHARRVLNGASSLTVSWSGSTRDEVVLTLTVRPRSFLPASMGIAPWPAISRTARVRVEKPVQTADRP